MINIILKYFPIFTKIYDKSKIKMKKNLHNFKLNHLK